MPKKEAPVSQVIDLMAAVKASLDASGPRQQESRTEAPAGLTAPLAGTGQPGRAVSLAEEIVRRLFRNGQREEAERLVLTQDGPPKRDLGGWCRSAAENVVRQVLEAAPLPGDGWTYCHEAQPAEPGEYEVSRPTARGWSDVAPGMILLDEHVSCGTCGRNMVEGGRLRETCAYCDKHKRANRGLHFRRTRYRPTLFYCQCKPCLAERIRRRTAGLELALGEHFAGCAYVNREAVFADAWGRECIPLRALNYGHGLLQDLMVARPPEHAFSRPRFAFILRRRDRAIAATVIQWLGSNIGFSWLTEVLDRCGYEVRPKARPRERESQDVPEAERS